ncbi:hypothetical protein BN946_scf184685.g3 [Trametes cinnabarina]|uniref:Myb/SANT-like domain-containing protein n=1 Tax=Pycnoporus cinnabarinus TaxID=5643 RepID=A0A060T1B9_PYCCI|nr:hypothetical protein BN946_scf184685.g3 [Trametes cinnabarina]
MSMNSSTTKSVASTAPRSTEPALVPTASGKENAKWTLEDEKTFVNYLTDHLAEQGDGNYKMSTFNAAAAVLEGMRAAGGPKTGTACKNKWSRIKETYYICYKLKHGYGTSGFTWSEEMGADIGIEDEAIWEAYVKKNPRADQFKHKGWPLFEAVDSIIPVKVKAKFIFAPSQAPVPNPLADEDSPTQSTDVEDPLSVEPDTSNEREPTETASPSAPYIPPPLPSPPPSSLGRKRSALDMTSSTSVSTGMLTPPITQQSPRGTAISRSIDRMSEVLANIVGGPPTEVLAGAALDSTPKRRHIAVELATQQEEDELSEDDMVELVEVMRRDITAADTYISLSKTKSKLRRAWVRRMVGRQYS